MQITISKLIALGVAITDLVLTATLGAPHDHLVDAALAVGAGLLLIWFADPLGSATGFIGHAEVTSETPAWMVAAFGWCVMLAAPLVLWWWR